MDRNLDGMDLEIVVAMDAKTTVEKLKPILAAAEAAAENGSAFSETFYAKSNNGHRNDIIVTFDNDDMERAEVAGDVFVDVDEQ